MKDGNHVARRLLTDKTSHDKRQGDRKSMTLTYSETEKLEFFPDQLNTYCTYKCREVLLVLKSPTLIVTSVIPNWLPMKWQKCLVATKAFGLVNQGPPYDCNFYFCLNEASQCDLFQQDHYTTPINTPFILQSKQNAS